MESWSDLNFQDSIGIAVKPEEHTVSLFFHLLFMYFTAFLSRLIIINEMTGRTVTSIIITRLTKIHIN